MDEREKLVAQFKLLDQQRNDALKALNKTQPKYYCACRHGVLISDCYYHERHLDADGFCEECGF